MKPRQPIVWAATVLYRCPGANSGRQVLEDERAYTVCDHCRFAFSSHEFCVTPPRQCNMLITALSSAGREGFLLNF